MTLWEYLKGKMSEYGEKVAFAHSGVTYKELLNLPCSSLNESKIVLCEGASREEQALKILRCLAEGNVAVPITKEYGEKNYRYICRLVEKVPSEARKDLAFLMFTSGTTGQPKGVMLTHENIISNLKYISSYFDLSGMKSICVARPLVHIAVLTGEILYALCCGLTIYFYEETFMPQRLLSYLTKNNTDVFCATPTLYQMLALIAKDRVFSVKVGVLSGEVLTSRVGENIRKAFPATAFYNVYGLTEHSPRVSALLPKDFSAGWLHTGDRAQFDSEGYLYIDGRKDGMLIKAGINVYPEEIENAVKEIPGVNDCVVFGETADTGTVICMKYTGNADIKEVRKHLSGELNPNVVPGKIEKVEELARTASGKKLRG